MQICGTYQRNKGFSYVVGVQEGYMGGEPITEEFFSEQISGKFNTDIGQCLFPDWEESRKTKWLDDKETLFRK